jgi:hypothetical protein|tara:strand:+ start:146 stop:652 length:507 start_codon:yes stop_codon:yes gene_type:complete
MPEYSLGFSEKLIEAADAVVPSCKESYDGRRTVLYLSLLASEIALKGLLEKAGKPISEIIGCQHRLSDLLAATDDCSVYTVCPGMDQHRWLPAKRIRALPIKVDDFSSTVGEFLSSERDGASKYPNEVRYGDSVAHFHPRAALEGARTLVAWAHEHWDCFRLKPSTVQ